MAVPEAYENMDINKLLYGLLQFGAESGIIRLIPGIDKSDAILHGTLTEEEKDIYRALFYKMTMTDNMVNEAFYIKDNAEKVAKGGYPNLPVLMFISNGAGGTGFDKDTWRSFQKNYIQNVTDGQYIELECPHYVHDYKYEEICNNIKLFLGSVLDIVKE